MIKVTGFLCSHVTLLPCCTCEPVTPTVLCISLESLFVGKSETCAELLKHDGGGLFGVSPASFLPVVFRTFAQR